MKQPFLLYNQMKIGVKCQDTLECCQGLRVRKLWVCQFLGLHIHKPQHTVNQILLLIIFPIYLPTKMNILRQKMLRKHQQIKGSVTLQPLEHHIFQKKIKIQIFYFYFELIVAGEYDLKLLNQLYVTLYKPLQ